MLMCWFDLLVVVQVEYIPQAKIASLFVVLGLVIVCEYFLVFVSRL